MATNGTSSPPSNFNASSTVPLWLDGKEVTSSSTFDVISPLDHKPLYKASSASEEDALKAIASAEKAAKSWGKTKPAERRDIFIRAAELFKKRKDELYHYSRTETGAPVSMFDFEHNLTYQACLSVAGLIQVATTATSPAVVEEGSSAMVVKEPYGVVLGIAPWNAPYVLGLRACLQPLAMYVSADRAIAILGKILTLRQGQCGHSQRPRSRTRDLLGNLVRSSRGRSPSRRFEHNLPSAFGCRTHHKHLSNTPGNQENKLHRLHQRRLHHCRPCRQESEANGDGTWWQSTFDRL